MTQKVQFKGGPLDGQFTSAVLTSGKKKTMVGCVTEAIQKGFRKGCYRLQGKHLVWVELGEDWSDELKRKWSR